ncbi:MAG: hydantoinase B/oxoprolinase family protein [Acidimicrobiales bacterium]
MYRIGVDTGGTFTDTVILAPGGRVGVGKALSTKHDLSQGILDSIDRAASTLGISGPSAIADAELIAHATTTGINALLTGTGARVGLLTTAGFEATVPIAKGNKVIGIDEEYRTEAAHWHKPPMLLPRRRIIGVRERIDAHGKVLLQLDEAHARESIRRLGDDEVEAIAISLLWSVVDPRHELRLAEIVAEELPAIHVSLSHEVAPRIGEYERSVTVLLNAYVAPLVSRYIERLGQRFAEFGFTGRFVVTQTSGGVRDATRIARTPVDTLNSGPVGGVAASLDLGRRLGHANVVATDVGGTSFDVGIVADGRLQFARRPMIGMYPLATPVVDLTSIGTGGGSIAWIDHTTGSLRVGPQSAGADPGPVCYGRGGRLPTVTDAAVALGYLDRLGGQLTLDAAAARSAIERELVGALDKTVDEIADDILRVANAQMADLVRRSTVQRGHDPADFALYAYGGAAPQYAGRYAEDLGVREVVVPALASVFSAYGAAATDLRALAEVELRPEPLERAVRWLPATLADLEARARRDITTDDADTITIERRVSLRFTRQVHALPIVLEQSDVLDADALAEQFRHEYERLVGTGTAFASAGVELVSVAVEARAPVVNTTSIVGSSHAPATGAIAVLHTRNAYFDGARRDCPVYDGTTMPAGARVEGPAFVELPTTTLVVYPGQTAVQHESGDITLRIGGLASVASARGELDPATFEVLRHRLSAINDEAAVTIGRVSGSPIATEGNDFNSGLMTADGETVVAGVYVLVHAAALGRIVRDIIDNYSENPGIGPGDMFITNDTYVGAPHQADVVVVAPIFDGDRLIAWCGSCVHQADVGGPVPGSITVGARNIYEEALPISPVKIVERGVIRKDIEREYLTRSRTPELNRLDLLGQIAANRVQSERILDLCSKYGTDTVVAAFHRLIEATEARLRSRLRSLPDGVWRHVGFCEHDGVEDRVYAVRCTMTKVGDGLEFDFTESSDQAPALINVAEPTLSGYAMTAVMTVLGYDLPWVPAAFWRVMSIKSRPGSVVHCTMPAGMSMGVTSAGQEVRTAVNICVSRLLDASDDPSHAAQILASCTSGSATSCIAGTHEDGRPFGTMILDGVGSGMGARTWGDGPDCGGFISSPSGSAVNVEVSELHFPMRYVWRRERPDSGGPGAFRGGVGADNLYVLHHAGAEFVSTAFAHGVQPPTSSGVAGGEPGMQNAFAVVRDGLPGADVDRTIEEFGGTVEWLPPKKVTSLAAGDAFANYGAGGGGFGDPLTRSFERVQHDVLEGLVSAAGALRDYGVVVDGDGVVDVARTQAARAARRGGPAIVPALDGARRLSSTLAVRAGRMHCRCCGHDLGPASENVKEHLVLDERSVGYRWPVIDTMSGAERFVVRRFSCPACAVQVDVEVNLAGSPFVWSASLFATEGDLS